MVDNIDKRLLYKLHWNCRQTYSELGKKLHISKQVIRYRINKLEKQGIIMSYHALIDWRKLGYNSIRIYLRWHNITPEVEEQIYKYIKGDPLFMWSVKFEGEFDIAFYIWVKSIPDFAQMWFKFQEKYQKYILKQEIYESVHMITYPMKPLVENYFVEEKIIGSEGKINFDTIDYEILKGVTKDARVPIIDLAKDMKLTPKAVIYRLKKLEKNGIILGYNALIDSNKLGYRFYKIDFYLNSVARLNEMFEFAKQHKAIVYRMRTLGGPDFEIEVMVKDVIEMKNILNEIRIRFSEVIEFYRFHRFEYTLKQIYLPGEKISE